MSSPECCQGFAFEFLGGDDEYTVWEWIGDVYYPQESSCKCPPEGHSRSFFTRPIFSRIDQYFFDFGLTNTVLIDVRNVCSRINEKSYVHGAMLLCSRLTSAFIGAKRASEALLVERPVWGMVSCPYCATSRSHKTRACLGVPSQGWMRSPPLATVP